MRSVPGPTVHIHIWTIYFETYDWPVLHLLALKDLVGPTREERVCGRAGGFLRCSSSTYHLDDCAIHTAFGCRAVVHCRISFRPRPREPWHSRDSAHRPRQRRCPLCMAVTCSIRPVPTSTARASRIFHDEVVAYRLRSQCVSIAAAV